MSHDTILFDMNSLAHAADAGARLTVGDMEVQAIFNTLRTLRNIAHDYPHWRLWCLWDGDREKSWRRDLLPEYKASRDAKTPTEQAKKDAYKKQVTVLRKILPFLGLKQLLVASAEADDCAGVLTRDITKRGASVVLITGDRDWLQLVRKNVVWIDHRTDRRVSEHNFLEQTGYFTPREFLEGKALQGDTSDDIPGVGGIGEKGAIELLAKYRSVDGFFARYDAGEAVKGKKLNEFAANVHGGRDKFARNLRLMNLIDAARPHPADVQITRPAYDEQAFQRVCERLAFQSILREFERFMTPFRATHHSFLKEAA